MKITLEVKPEHFDALDIYSKLTSVSVNTQIDEALSDYVACVLAARLENIASRPTLIGFPAYIN